MDALRTEVVARLADHIGHIRRPHPVRVAIDGRTASGKTTLANEIAEALQGRAIRASMDGFHRSKAMRYARGRYSAEGYFHDARDLQAVRRLLLDPLGPEGNRFYRIASFDLEKDKPLELEPILAASDAILIVDGTFLQRDELSPGWDVTVFVQVAETTAMQRGTARDQSLLGGLEAAQAVYDRRYRPAFRLYERACRPLETADVVFDNECFERPTMEVRRQRCHSSKKGRT